MTIKHTPGPWNQIVYAGDQHTSIVNADQTHIAAVNKKNDAALISAAPDLLRVVQDLMSDIIDLSTVSGDDVSSCHYLYDSAKAAIDKATSKGHGQKTPKAEMDANARLISAAPDLLEALQGAIETADGTAGMSESWWYAPARVAIAKATYQQGQ